MALRYTFSYFLFKFKWEKNYLIKLAIELKYLQRLAVLPAKFLSLVINLTALK